MKKTGTGWRGFLTLSLAAALAGAAPAGALAASPEFARTPEEWESRIVAMSFCVPRRCLN